MRKFKHKLLPIILEEIPNTGMSIVYKDNYGRNINSIFVHGSSLFIQFEGDPIKGMDYQKEYPIGFKVRPNNTSELLYYEKIGNNSWNVVYDNGQMGSIGVILDESEIRIGGKYKIVEEKHILFTTEDGVEIREGQTYYTRNSAGDIIKNEAKFCCVYFYNNKKFSTEKAIKEWLISQKPVIFTTSDGVQMRDQDIYWYVIPSNNIGHFIISKDLTCEFEAIYLSNPSLQSYYLRITFSNEEKAKEYVINNKKCLSLADINEAVKEGNYCVSDVVNYLKKKIIEDKE